MASETTPGDVPDKEARSARDLWLEAVISMIELTQNGEIQWRVGSELLPGQGQPITPPYYADYKTQTYRLEERWLPAPLPTAAEQVLRPLRTLSGDKPPPRGTYIVSLDVVDSHGLSLFSVPHVGPLRDLLKTVQKQTAADKALKDLLSAATISDEEQQQRVREVVQRETGEDCPELEVVRARAILGGGLVRYRCKAGDPSESLKLTPEDAEYVGIDMSVRERPETGG